MRLTPEPISRGYDSERVENTSTLVSRTALGRIRYGVAQHPCPPWFSTWRRVPAPRVARSTIRPVAGYGAFVRCAFPLGWSLRRFSDDHATTSFEPRLVVRAGWRWRHHALGTDSTALGADVGSHPRRCRCFNSSQCLDDAPG